MKYFSDKILFGSNNFLEDYFLTIYLSAKILFGQNVFGHCTRSHCFFFISDYLSSESTNRNLTKPTKEKSFPTIVR